MTTADTTTTGCPRGPRTWLVGEHNPFGAHPDHALYPYPPGCSGARLCGFLGLSEDEYLARFERRNLLSQARWSAPAARKAAAMLLGELGEGDRLVLLGAKVARAFGYDFEPLATYDGRVDRTGVAVVVSGPEVGLDFSLVWFKDAEPASVTDPDTDAPDGAVVNGLHRAGDQWVPHSSAIGVKVLLAPHPSGLNRIWADKAMPAKLRAALAELEGAVAA